MAVQEIGSIERIMGTGPLKMLGGDRSQINPIRVFMSRD